jgi:hypothetical protein
LAIDLIFLDFEKAFDRIPISLLIEKMKNYNIDQNLLPVIKDMLIKRVQYVNFNGTMSDTYEVESGKSGWSLFSSLF